MFKTAFINSLKRGVRKLTERRLYIFAMVVIPLFVTFFLLGLMKNGLPNHIPTAIVDLDNSTARAKWYAPSTVRWKWTSTTR